MEAKHSLASQQLSDMFAPIGIQGLLASFSEFIDAQNEALNPHHAARDTLVRLNDHLQTHAKAVENKRHAEESLRNAVMLRDSLVSARVNVLSDLYDDIKARFVQFYGHIHSSDENAFAASFRHQDASFHLDVSFFGEGYFPPQALHSEGHQDTMGLCLFLALSERLAEPTIDLVILDDVMMSIDSEHRRRVCDLLKTQLNNRQLLITTHDRTWASQLLSEGVAHRSDSTEFRSWSLDYGTLVRNQPLIWEEIESSLADHNVRAAASALRYGLEEFFAHTCDYLEAQIVYRISGNWDLGDYLPAAVGQYKTLIRRAKKSANAWGNQEVLDDFAEIESVFTQTYQRCRAEQWGINPNVHYNNWINFTIDDFRPIVAAFRDLLTCFQCTNCGSSIRLVQQGKNPVNVACQCNKILWNLQTPSR